MSIFLSLLGGLGLFLFGMKMMSEGLEKAAGAKLRTILEAMTKNRFVGVLVGTVFTAIIQSSSAATVMVVSFVNAGLMNLTQAASVIMGANIGTTVTSQLVSLDLSEIAPLFLFIGVIMVMFCKKPIVKKIGEVVLGFGVLFMGLSIMSGSMENLKDSPAIVNTLSGLKNPILAMLVGLALTALIQSSSVTVSVILVMATQGLLGLPICFFMTLGCNIGACVSALLASLSGKKDAKRAAMIHFSFNVIGTIIIAVILAVGMDQVEALVRAISGDNPGRCVANAHTMFKVFQVIILFPFAGWLVKLVNILVPGQDAEEAEEFQLKYIGKTAVFSPTTAVVETVREIEAMGDLAVQNLQDSVDAFFQKDSQKASRVYQVEKKLDFLCKEITDYLVRINQKEQLPLADTIRIGGLFHVVNDIERIGDHAENFADAAVSFVDEELELTKKASKELVGMYEKVKEILTMSLEMFSTEKEEHLDQILTLENEIDEMERSLQKSHVRRLAKGKCSASAGVVYMDMVTGLERIADHATNIAFSILDKDPEEDFEA